jgi:hypothetical protein
VSHRAALRAYPPPFQSTGPLSTGSTKKDALRRCSTSEVDGTCDLRLRAHIRLFASHASDFCRVVAVAAAEAVRGTYPDDGVARRAGICRPLAFSVAMRSHCGGPDILSEIQNGQSSSRSLSTALRKPRLRGMGLRHCRAFEDVTKLFKKGNVRCSASIQQYIGKRFKLHPHNPMRLM